MNKAKTQSVTDIILEQTKNFSAAEYLFIYLHVSSNNTVDADKLRRISQVIQCVNPFIRNYLKTDVSNIINVISDASGSDLLNIEKVLLTNIAKYRRKVFEGLHIDPNLSKSIIWCKINYAVADNCSVSTQEVYCNYLAFCDQVKMQPLSSPLFTNTIIVIFPEVEIKRPTKGNRTRYYDKLTLQISKSSPVLFNTLSNIEINMDIVATTFSCDQFTSIIFNQHQETKKATSKKIAEPELPVRDMQVYSLKDDNESYRSGQLGEQTILVHDPLALLNLRSGSDNNIKNVSDNSKPTDEVQKSRLNRFLETVGKKKIKEYKHPSVTKILKTLPRCTLPSELYQSNISPNVALDKRHVTNWYIEQLQKLKKRVALISTKRLPSRSYQVHCSCCDVSFGVGCQYVDQIDYLKSQLSKLNFSKPNNSLFYRVTSDHLKDFISTYCAEEAKDEPPIPKKSANVGVTPPDTKMVAQFIPGKCANVGKTPDTKTVAAQSIPGKNANVGITPDTKTATQPISRKSVNVGVTPSNAKTVGDQLTTSMKSISGSTPEKCKLLMLPEKCAKPKTPINTVIPVTGSLDESQSIIYFNGVLGTLHKPTSSISKPIKILPKDNIVTPKIISVEGSKEVSKKHETPVGMNIESSTVELVAPSSVVSSVSQPPLLLYFPGSSLASVNSLSPTATTSSAMSSSPIQTPLMSSVPIISDIQTMLAKDVRPSNRTEPRKHATKSTGHKRITFLQQKPVTKMLNKIPIRDFKNFKPVKGNVHASIQRLYQTYGNAVIPKRVLNTDVDPVVVLNSEEVCDWYCNRISELTKKVEQYERKEVFVEPAKVPITVKQYESLVTLKRKRMDCGSKKFKQLKRRSIEESAARDKFEKSTVGEKTKEKANENEKATEENPYSCSFCLKQLHNEEQLLYHSRIHLSCKKCKKRVKTIEIMRTHLTNHCILNSRNNQPQVSLIEWNGLNTDETSRPLAINYTKKKIVPQKITPPQTVSTNRDSFGKFLGNTYIWSNPKIVNDNGEVSTANVNNSYAVLNPISNNEKNVKKNLKKNPFVNSNVATSQHIEASTANFSQRHVVYNSKQTTNGLHIPPEVEQNLASLQLLTNRLTNKRPNRLQNAQQDSHLKKMLLSVSCSNSPSTVSNVYSQVPFLAPSNQLTAPSNNTDVVFVAVSNSASTVGTNNIVNTGNVTSVLNSKSLPLKETINDNLNKILVLNNVPYASSTAPVIFMKQSNLDFSKNVYTIANTNMTNLYPELNMNGVSQLQEHSYYQSRPCYNNVSSSRSTPVDIIEEPNVIQVDGNSNEQPQTSYLRVKSLQELR